MNANAEPQTADVRSRVNTRYRSYGLLTDYFPLTLSNGVEVKGIAAECSRCQQRLTPNMFRGEVREVVAKCFRVTAIGWCTDCDLLTPYLFHIVPHENDEDYDLIPLDYRGWPEQYESSVVQFRPRMTCEEVKAQSNTG